MFLRPALASLALLLASCAQNPATGAPMFTMASQKQLRDSGDATAQNYLKAEGLYRPGSPVSAYVTNICNSIYAVTEAASEAVQCNLSDDGTFNAFATTGYIFMQRGMLPFLNSEDELAAVLGHEAGHLTARHMARRATQGAVTNLLLTGGAIAVAGATGGGDFAAMQTYNNLGNAAGRLGLAKFSRSHETEADELGRRYLAKAGYSPAASVGVTQALLNYTAYMGLRQKAFGEDNATLFEQLESSHPASAERVAAAISATGGPVQLAPEQDLSRQRYMNAINGLAWGPQRRYGIARKNELVLTRQRVVIPFPQAVTTNYLPSNHPRNLGEWLIAHPQSGVFMRLSSVQTQTGSNPAVMVEKMLPTLHSKVERITIGSGQNQPAAGTSLDDLALADDETPTGSDAAADAALADDDMVPPAEVTGYTATYRFLNSPKRFRVVAFGAATRANEMIYYTITYPNLEVMDREDPALMAVLKNVKFLTRTQALKYQPLQIQTFHAAAGDSVARQASHLPVSSLSEELFRTLNNLPEGTGMQVGQIYKTIRDPNP